MMLTFPGLDPRQPIQGWARKAVRDVAARAGPAVEDTWRFDPSKPCEPQNMRGAS